MVQQQKRSGAWDVRQGSSADIASGLETDHAQVLAFVVAGEDDATREKKFALLKQVAVLMDDLLDVRRIEKWNAVVEALTPDLELSPTKLREAKMMSAARSAVLESGDFAPSSAIAELGSFSVKNPSSQPNRWKQSRQIFAITHRGIDLYPLYALSTKDGVRPLPVVTEILQVLDGKNGWEVAFWFAGVNSYLGGRAPKEIVASDPEAVLKAAMTEATGLQHG
jgi:hypothetical protein